MARNIDNPAEMGINRIVEGTIIEGDIRSESNVRIDGHFKGHIHTSGRLVVGPTGIVEGTVLCQNSEVEGFVNGKFQVNQLLTLKETAKVEGDIITDKISIQPGAMFTGTCSMGAKVKDISDSNSTESQKLGEKTA